MEEDTEYKKLPVDERCVHKLWKARVDGYEEAAKLFRTIDDEKSPEWNKYLGLVKKFVVDSNAVAQEKGLEATLVFVENCGHAGKTVGEVMSGIVTKCIGAPKAKTRDMATQITLMYVEIEKHELVLEELLKGTEQKNPKIVSGCVVTVTQALREFGSKVISVKPIVKRIPALLTDRDKTVRDESKTLTVEIFRWIGPAFKSQIASLPAVLLAELETEFEKIKADKATPTRYLRSQQERAAAVAAVTAEEDGEADDGDAEEGEEIDPMDLIDPIDILSKLPKDFYEKLEAKKWQERKESLEALEKLLENPKLAPGDYADLVRALKKVITKDTNVVLVALAGKCLAGVAKGLGKKFQPYGVACVQGILEKFKEKKPNVVTALREAIDAIYPSITLEAIQEDVIEALNNKNPAVKAETASFLARCFSKTQPAALNKKLLKAYITALLKTLNEPDPAVRDAAADALGTSMKLLGEKAVAPFLSEVDALKMAKIKECCEKAIITVKIVGVKKERPATAPPAKTAAASTKGGSTEPKPVARPTTSAAGAKKNVKKTAPSAPALAKSASSKAVPAEREFSEDEVDERAAELLPPDVVAGLQDAQWKNRVAAAESMQTIINTIEPAVGISQVIVRVLAKKPGLKDNNIQASKLRLDLVKMIADRLGMSTTTADFIINDIVEKLGDAKSTAAASQALTAITDATKLEYVVGKVMSFAFEQQKSPKVQQEALLWVNGAIRDFGFQVNSKALLEDAKKAVQSVNPAVRGAGIALLGTMHLYMGNGLTVFFENEKAALKQQIFAEFEKNAGQKAPPPSRGVSKSSSKASVLDGDEMEEYEETPAAGAASADLFPRVDIAPQITESLLAEMADKNWKTRNEGLTKLQNILNEAKMIKSSIGDLPQALAHRLIDSNANIARLALEIATQLATAMGPGCKQHVTTLFPGFLKSVGDSKPVIRASGINCINAWGEQCGYKEFFTGEMIADGLKTGSPALRTEMWGWLAEKLPALPPKSVPKEELVACLPHLYANICDRNADVRKNANEAVLGIMIHIGYDAMLKALDKQKPASKKDIQAALDKARPNLPMKPLPKNKQQAPLMEETKVIRTGKNAGKNGPAVSKPGTAVASRKKEEELDTSPLLAVNNCKHQRLLDEQKLKVLKWTFTTPREEFIDLLKDQMITASVNKSLMANMFHEDFRYHLKAIDSLLEDLPGNSKGLVCNLDLILKWVSLRFYDTNPSVLLKALDYLNAAFEMLVDSQYTMADNEGSCFIPHLLTKIGDPKDAVRNSVRSLLHEICHVYSFNKVFLFVMDALKSKNARQRTECLDVLSYLIETYGLTVCQPSAASALKEIAKNISDRDNSVRSAALNCIVQAYFLAGEKVYKMIGQLSDKDLSMLDERIKRSKRPQRKPMPAIDATARTTVAPVTVEAIDVDDELPAEDELPLPEESVQQQHVSEVNGGSESGSAVGRLNELKRKMQRDAMGAEANEIHEPVAPRTTGPFRLDPQIIDEIEKGWVRVDQMPEKPLKQIDLSFLDKPITAVPTNSGVSYPVEKLRTLMAHTSPARASSAASHRTYNVSPPQAMPPSYGSGAVGQQRPATAHSTITSPPPKLDPNLLRVIRNLGSQDQYTAHAAINELADILEAPEKQAVLRDYEELYVQSILAQYKHLSQKPVAEALVMYQPLLHSTYTFFNTRILGRTLGVPSIKSLMAVLLGLMADNKLGASEETQYTKVINGICLKILDRTNFTHLNCALIRLLKETCSGSALPKFTDLLMKCIWRNVKMLPERCGELDYDAVLLEIHEFMLLLPPAWWQQRPSDTPLRTVKTIIHNITKMKGNGILQHLNKIPTHSELNTYVLRVLKNLNKENPSGTANGNAADSQTHKDSKRQMARATHEQVSNIFKLISDKETSQEGLYQLYDFKVSHPDVDIMPFLRGASATFQKYILDGLEDIEQARSQGSGAPQRGPPMTNSTNSSAPEYWMEKLNSLKQKANKNQQNPYDGSENNAMDNKIADENLNLNQFQSQSAVSTTVKKDIHVSITEGRLHELQQKLAQLKHTDGQC